MYTQDELIACNTLYHHEHGVTPSDVEKINSLIALIEEQREVDPPILTDGDVVICVSPTKGVVSTRGHIQRYQSFTNYMTICTDPYVPFIDSNLRSNASGGYWKGVEESDFANFIFVGQQKKTFCAWGHNGMYAHGAINFQTEVFVWEFTHPSFY